MKYTLTQDAKDRLERVAKLIEEEPLRINMNDLNGINKIPLMKQKPMCNTVGCVAGWIVADQRAQKRVKEGLDPFPWDGLLGEHESWVIPVIATELLGLGDESEGDSRIPVLFNVCDWPDYFQHEHTEDCLGAYCWLLRGNPDPGTPEYAAVVAERIRYFIEHGE